MKYLKKFNQINEFFFNKKKMSPEEYTQWVEDQEGEYYEECPECSRYGITDDCSVCNGEGQIPLQDTNFGDDKYNEDISNDDVENTPNEIFITKKNTATHEYREPRFSPYVEDGELSPAKFIICHDMDVDGRYRTGVLGIYKIKPEYFDVRVNKSRFDKTYYSYRLNKTGWDALSALGRCSQTFDLVDDEYIQNMISKNERSIESLQRGIDKYKALLSEL